MPDPSGPEAPPGAPVDRPWWRRLGALLPPGLRERVFEPACYERLHRHLDGERGGVPIALYPFFAFVGTAGRNFPRVLFHRGRLSCLGKYAAATLLGALVFVWAINAIRYAYAG